MDTTLLVRVLCFVFCVCLPALKSITTPVMGLGSSFFSPWQTLSPTRTSIPGERQFRFVVICMEPCSIMTQRMSVGFVLNLKEIGLYLTSIAYYK